MAEISAGQIYQAANKEAVGDHSISYQMIPVAGVKQMLGGISDMTVWRWLNDPTMNFPRPTYLGRRRYWRQAEVLAWLESQRIAAE